MRPTVWLASYPKSGNTWFRILLANLDPDRTTPAEINAIDSSDSIASARARFDNNLMIESGLLSFDEIDDLRPAFYRHMAQDSFADAFDPTPRYPVRFVKTHDGYTSTRAGVPLMGGARAAAGALVFVRDPRDVVGSFANHEACSIDDAIARMADPGYAFCAPRREQVPQLRQRLLGWGAFAASWLDQRDIPVHCVRYEDLHAAPVATLTAALAFAGWPMPAATIARAVAFASIEELQRQERAVGFAEKSRDSESFFRKGVVGGWRDELSPEQVGQIERDHLAMMRRLGYVPA